MLLPSKQLLLCQIFVVTISFMTTCFCFMKFFSSSQEHSFQICFGKCSYNTINSHKENKLSVKSSWVLASLLYYRGHLIYRAPFFHQSKWCTMFWCVIHYWIVISRTNTNYQSLYREKYILALQLFSIYIKCERLKGPTFNNQYF